MYFKKETELCNNFIRRFAKFKDIKFSYELNTSAVSIVVYHKTNFWNEKRGRKYVNRLIKKYNLAFIGYKNECIVLRKNNFELEYMILMIHFNLDNYYSENY